MNLRAQYPVQKGVRESNGYNEYFHNYYHYYLRNNHNLNAFTQSGPHIATSTCTSPYRSYIATFLVGTMTVVAAAAYRYIQRIKLHFIFIARSYC